jgi:hypothetical protein
VLCVEDALEEDLEPDDAIVVVRVVAGEELEDDDWVVVCVGTLVVVRVGAADVLEDDDDWAGVCACSAVGVEAVADVSNFLRLLFEGSLISSPPRFMAKADVVRAAKVRLRNNVLIIFMITVHF